MPFNLNDHGDSYEKYYQRIIDERIPLYNAAWLKYICPRTGRPDSIAFKSELNKDELEICQNTYSSMLYYCFSFDKVESGSQTSTLAKGASGLLCNHGEEIDENPIDYKDFIFSFTTYYMAINIKEIKKLMI